jgi:hypothetical protein
MHRAQWVRIVGAAAALLEGTACATLRRPDPPPTAQASDRDTEADGASRWHVVFVSTGTSGGSVPMEGWASMRSGASRSNTSILLNVTHADPGTVHPWELHHGRCGADQGIYGPAGAYEPLTVDAGGRGAGQATVRMPLPTEGPFFIRVAASPASPETTVACGDLVPPTP